MPRISGVTAFVAIAPFFPEYRPFAESNGAKLVAVPADIPSFQINWEALEAAVNAHTQALILNDLCVYLPGLVLLPLLLQGLPRLEPLERQQLLTQAVVSWIIMKPPLQDQLKKAYHTLTRFVGECQSGSLTRRLRRRHAPEK